MTIHWWNTDKVVERLAEGSVSEQEAMRYAMISAVLYTQATYFATWFGGYRSWLLIYEFFVVTIIALVGVSECFKANGGVQGVDFLKRLSVIGVPVGIKVALAGTAMGQIIYFSFPYVVTPTSFRDPAFVYQIISFAFAASFMFIFYWRLALHLSRLQRRERSNPAVQGTLRDEAAQRP
jgi:hypothetical protein